MRFGIAFANILGFGEPDGAKVMGQAAEAAGFDSVWTVEHVLVPKGYESQYPYDPSGKMPGPDEMPLTDPLIWLTWVAAHTSTLKLATGVLVLPQRNPGIVAKEVATLDRLSGGRVVLGVGAGWLGEEFEALGVPFEDRGKRFDAYIEALRALWTESPATLDNGYVTYKEVFSRPAPVHGTVPLVVGGHSEVAARRAGRLGDGFFPGRGTVEELRRLIEVVRRSAESAGRDPDAVEITASDMRIMGPDAGAAVEELSAMGVSRIMVPPLAFDPDGLPDALAAFGERVITPAAG